MAGNKVVEGLNDWFTHFIAFEYCSFLFSTKSRVVWLEAQGWRCEVNARQPRAIRMPSLIH
jgi:hypothetical protein